MGDEFYCVIKLVSGEEIFSLVCVDDNDDNPIIIMENPVIIKTIQNSNGFYIKVKPWIEYSSDNIFIVKMDKIITMTESYDEKLIGLYKNYLSESDDGIEVYKPGGEVELSSEMGYVSSVEESRIKLENQFKDLKEG
jgi:hypothetical protein